MQPYRRLLAAFAAALGLASSAGAELVADLQAPFAISLKLTTTTPVKVRPILGGNEISNRFTVVRFTARDLLADLIEEGRIVGPLAGWRIVARTTSDEAAFLAHRLYATKAGQPDHALDVDDARVLALELPYAEAAFRVRVRDERVVYERSEFRFALDGVLATPALPLDLAGSGSLLIVGRAIALGDEEDFVNVPRFIKTRLSGGGLLSEPEAEPVLYLVEGAIGFGEHRITSVRVAPPAD